MTTGHTDRWQETRQTLCELLAWLDQTSEWVRCTARRDELEDEEAAEAERVFAEDQTIGSAARAESAADSADAWQRGELSFRAEDEVTGPVDMAVIVAMLTALRHELKLQTRAARQDRELAAKTLEALGEAVGQFERLRGEEASRREAAVAEATGVAAELLMDLHDALSRSAAEAVRVVRTAIAQQHALLPRHDDAAGARNSGRGWIGRIRNWGSTWIPALRPARPVPMPPGREREAGSSMPGAVEPLTVRHTSGSLETLPSSAAQFSGQLESVLESLSLSARRLERALTSFGIEPVDTLGRTLDPETMEAVQATWDPAQPLGAVIAEIRRGYLRQGGVLRYAQVVVNRASTPETTSGEPAV